MEGIWIWLVIAGFAAFLIVVAKFAPSAWEEVPKVTNEGHPEENPAEDKREETPVNGAASGIGWIGRVIGVIVAILWFRFVGLFAQSAFHRTIPRLPDEQKSAATMLTIGLLVLAIAIVPAIFFLIRWIQNWPQRAAARQKKAEEAREEEQATKDEAKALAEEELIEREAQKILEAEALQERIRQRAEELRAEQTQQASATTSAQGETK